MICKATKRQRMLLYRFTAGTSIAHQCFNHPKKVDIVE